MPDASGPETFGYRIRRTEHDVEKLWDEKADSKDLSALTEEVRNLRRVLVGFALSVAGSAVVFAFAVFELVGRH